MADLFPAAQSAQAVLDVWLASEKGGRILGDPSCLAAAIEELANQVAPESVCDPVDQEEWIGQSTYSQACCVTRLKILSIAAQLRN